MKIVSDSTYNEMMYNHLELTEDLYFEIPSGEKLRKFCKKIRYGLHPEIFNYYQEHDLFTAYKDYLVIHNDSLWKELKKKDEDSKMIRTNYELKPSLDKAHNKFKYKVCIRLPYDHSDPTITYDVNLFDRMCETYETSKKEFNSDKYIVDCNDIVITELVSNKGNLTSVYILPDNDGNFVYDLPSIYAHICGTIKPDGSIVFDEIPEYRLDGLKENEEYIVGFNISFNLVEKEHSNQTTGNLKSSGPWAEPDKVKAIRETIELVMKNTGKTDLKDMDLDMLSSCINATFNREKLFYKWLNEFTSDEVDKDTVKFAFDFLYWVLSNKVDNNSSLYLKV